MELKMTKLKPLEFKLVREDFSDGKIRYSLQYFDLAENEWKTVCKERGSCLTAYFSTPVQARAFSEAFAVENRILTSKYVCDIWKI